MDSIDYIDPMDLDSMDPMDLRFSHFFLPPPHSHSFSGASSRRTRLTFSASYLGDAMQAQVGGPANVRSGNNVVVRRLGL